MQFDLQIINEKYSERILVGLKSLQPRSFGNIIGVFDTGSSRTIISARDAHMLKIPLASLRDSQYPVSGFGRGKIPCKVCDKFKLALKSKEDKIKIFEIPLHIVDTTALKNLNSEFERHAYQIPTIIGLDFLKGLNLSLKVNMNNKEAYMEENIS